MGVNFFHRDERDLKFVLKEQLDLDRLLSYKAFQDFSTADFNMILDEAFKAGREILGPASQDGDREGCTYRDGIVTVPASFRECWQFLSEKGWMAPIYNPAFGGQGLPCAVGGLVYEILYGANLAIMGFAGLAVGNGHLIEAFGTDADRALFVEKMYTGVWGGTMCLTEPDAGSDVGWIRTKAVPDPGSQDPRIYRISGTKRFISCGKHDLTENIIHLLLARIEGSPQGTKGISLFIVPEIWVEENGALGQGNDVFCSGIEHKMGTHGLATCTLNFGEGGACRGILLGEPNSGMSKMFQVMNEARIACANQSLALAASAYDTARIYAKERIQGAPFTNRHAGRVPIIHHEDVRRMLMNLKSGTEAMRALVARTFYLMDVSEHDPDEAARKSAHGLLELFTPLIKGYIPDLSYVLIRDAIQILGGVGYSSEFPVEQYARDVKIESIWEGTSYIQSLDLVGRKLGMGGGQVFQGWLKGIVRTCQEDKANPEFAKDCDLLARAVQVLGEMAMRYMQYFQDGRLQLIPLTSTRFLDSACEVALADVILEQGRIARKRLKDVAGDSPEALFYRGKMETAKFFCRNILTNIFSRQVALEQEDLSAVEIPEEAF